MKRKAFTLIELAIVLTIIGIIIGVGLGSILGNAMDITVVPSIPTILISFGFSACVGIFFGWYPANKASKLNPIEALRFE